MTLKGLSSEPGPGPLPCVGLRPGGGGGQGAYPGPRGWASFLKEAAMVLNTVGGPACRHLPWSLPLQEF